MSWLGVREYEVAEFCVNIHFSAIQSFQHIIKGAHDSKSWTIFLDILDDKKKVSRCLQNKQNT